jgi:hypothetical protein
MMPTIGSTARPEKVDAKPLEARIQMKLRWGIGIPDGGRTLPVLLTVRRPKRRRPAVQAGAAPA